MTKMYFFAAVRTHAAAVAVGVLISYCAIAWVLPNNPLLVFLRACEASIALTAIVGLWRTVRVVWADGYAVNEEHVYALGDFLQWFGVFLNATWLYVWRTADEPVWMANSAVNGFCVVLICLGGLLKITAPGAIKGEFPRAAFKLLATCAVSIAILFGTALAFHRQIKELTIWARPYLSENGADGNPRFLRDEE